jgi:hypothetical protein
VQTNVLIKEECILKNKNKLCPYKKLSVFYNSYLKTYVSHLVCACIDIHIYLHIYVNICIRIYVNNIHSYTVRFRTVVL